MSIQDQIYYIREHTMFNAPEYLLSNIVHIGNSVILQIFLSEGQTPVDCTICDVRARIQL